MASNLYLDRTMADAAKFEADLRAQTPDSVRAALARHLKPAEISVFTAGDFVGGRRQGRQQRRRKALTRPGRRGRPRLIPASRPSRWADREMHPGNDDGH